MSKRVVLAGVAICLCFLLIVVAQKQIRNYHYGRSLVSRTDSAEANPRTALLKSDSLLHVALKAQNGPLVLKALIDRIVFQTEISTDSFPSLIRQVEQITAASGSEVERAVLYSLQAEMYESYYLANRSDLEGRTALGDTVPSDISQWSANLFVRKIADLTEASLAPASILQTTNVQDYAPAIKEGSDSRVLRPTMFDFLAYRAISIYEKLIWIPVLDFDVRQVEYNPQFYAASGRFIGLPLPVDNYLEKERVLGVFQQLLSFRQDDRQSPAYLMCDLDRLTYVYNNFYTPDRTKEYEAALLRLIDEYKDSPYSVEAIADLADLFSSSQEFDKLNEALNLCRQGITRFPGYERIGCLKGKIELLTRPDFSLTMNKLLYPGTQKSVNVNYKNVKQLHVGIYKMPVSGESEISDAADVEVSGKMVYEQVLPVSDTLTLINKEYALQLPPLKEGVYAMTLFADTLQKNKKRIVFYVTGLYGSSHTLPEDKRQVIVTDWKTGKPRAKVAVLLYKTPKYQEYQYVTTLYTDKNGLAEVTDPDITTYRLADGKDAAYPYSALARGYNNAREEDSDSYLLDLFTDRGVYRPGQPLYFSGIVYSTEPDDMKVLAGEKVTVSLNDANNKEVSRQEVVSDAFGSFAGQFTLPSGKLTGSYTLWADDVACNIEVAEYKRPTFEIIFDPIRDSYSFGRKVTITGQLKSYSGIALPFTPVRYQIDKRPHWLRFISTRNYWPVANGEVLTDSTGRFTLQFVPEIEKGLTDALYRYNVEVEATSLSGETQTATTFLSVGVQQLIIRANLPRNINKDKPVSLPISTVNLMGQPIQASCKYILYSLYENKEITEWVELPKLGIRTQQEEVAFESDKTPLQADWSKLPSGAYRLVVQATGSDGKMVSEDCNFILYGTKDKRPPTLLYQWAPQTEYTCVAGGTAEVLYGSSVKNAYLLYELYDMDERVVCKRMKIGDQNVRFKIPYKDDYGPVLSLYVSFVKEGKVYSTEFVIRQKQPDRMLNIVPETFRDRLQPGSAEQWTFRVKDASGQPVTARFMTEMFDASLNAISPHDWYFNPVTKTEPYRVNWSFDGMTGWMGSGGAPVYITCPAFEYDQLDIPFSLLYTDNFMYGRKMAMYQSRAGGLPGALNGVDVSMEDSPLEEVVVSGVSDAKSKTDEGDGQSDDRAAYREIFNETAFFYPQLVTDATGEVAVRFTIPESNTQWQFMALAYTKDLEFGRFDTTIVTSKPLMVAPNLPRFVRQGDEVTFVTNISNQTSVPQDGKFTFELFNPYTDSVLTTQNQAYVLLANQSKPVMLNFNIPGGCDLLGVRVMARSTQFADGEQHVLPVLPSRALVTETLPFYLEGAGTQAFTLEKLAQQKTKTSNYRLTLDYTRNPVWYVVQALPGLNDANSENVIDIVSSFYSSTISEAIVKNNKDIAIAVKNWQAKGGDKNTLISDLEKNPALKSILLEETPWVLDAATITGRMQSLANLFDVNRLSYLQQTALSKLAEMQMPDGGWAWFKGMRSNAFITMNVLQDMSRLVQLNMIEYDEQGRRMQMDALKYLDQQMETSVNLNNKKAYLDEVRYLYIRSAYRDIPLTEPVLTKHKALIDQLRNGWTVLSLNDKAMAAIALYRYGFADDAARILRSLREYATQTKEMGMFWQNNRANRSQTMGAIEVHTMIMSAFAEVEPEAPEMKAMAQWLLLQKQAQDWGSRPATADAVYAVLSSGGDWLTLTAPDAKIEWGGETVQQTPTDPLSGYVQVTRQGNEINSRLATVSVTATGDQPSWGALYWQYFEDFGKITKSSGKVLSVDEAIFVNRNNELIPVSKASLKPGDKITVRVVINTDRDLEFVYLKNQRAACFEPIGETSGYQSNGSLSYYEESRDAATNLFFDFIPKGTHVIEYNLWLDRVGMYNNGIVSVQCMYAPEISAHTQGGVITIK